MKNSLKSNYVFRAINRIMNDFQYYPFVKLKGPLTGHKAKIHNFNYTRRAPETHVARIMQERILPEEIALDIGTHFGYYTLLMAKRVGPYGKVISFEPSKETRQILIDNIMKNNYQKRVIVEGKGVSDKKKILSFSANKFSPMNSFSNEDSARGPKIECIDLDSYCKENDIKPDFLKIDVEGVEKEVIEGMKNILKKYSPKVLLEGGKETKGIEDIFKIFKKNKYKIYSWKKRLDEDSWIDLQEITKPEETITKHVYFER